MKIVYFLKAFADKAGTERIFSDKMNYLARNCGYDITFITYEQSNHPMAFPLDKSISVIDLNVRFLTIYKLTPIIRCFAKLRKLILLKSKLNKALKQINPDYIIITTYEFDKFCCILSLPYRFVIESHICMSSVKQGLRQQNVISKCIAKWFDKINFRNLNKAYCLVSLTNKDKKEWEKNTNIPIFIIPNFVTYFPEKIIPYSERQNRIICVGRLTMQKGFDYLIDAWSLISNNYPEWKIDIFGHGELEEDLNKMIMYNNLESSIIIHKPTERIYEEYEHSTIFILSSRYEGFAIVLLEAMSCGVPCISFDCPNGPSDIISQGENGILVPYADINKLAESIEWMIEHNQDRQKMSENARNTAHSYTQDLIMPQWISLFNSPNIQE